MTGGSYNYDQWLDPTPSDEGDQQPDWIVENEHGFWCPACGDLIAKPGEDKSVMPLSCELCGYPDFEDGPGYFTDDTP